MSGARGVGFWRGFVAPFNAARRLLQLPRAWPFVIAPALVFVVLEIAFIGVSWRVVKPWASSALAGVTWLPPVLATGASWLAATLAVVLGWLLAVFLAPMLTAPALERIVGITEKDLRAPERLPLGFFAEFWCGARALLVSLAVTLPVLLVLTLLELFVPPLAVVITPLKLLLGALGVAWGLFDYPLTLRGIGARQRFAFMKRHFTVVLGFGSAFSLLFWLPCVGLLMLPVGVAAATRLYWEIERA
jgi:uncharacterized protein involved in cysteine biosynthesis